MLDDTENGPAFHDFLNGYAVYQIALLFASFWHVFFLIAMGTLVSLLIYMKISYTDTTTDVMIGYKLFIWGTMFGIVDYIAATGLSVNDDTILMMTGFLSKADTDGEITKSSVTNADGEVTTTTTSTEYATEAKKNFFAMNDVMSMWPDLFFVQQSIQMFLPFLYIGLLEVAVGMIFLLTLYAWI